MKKKEMGQGCNTEINKKKEGEKDAKVKYGIDVRSMERKHMKKKKKGKIRRCSEHSEVKNRECSDFWGIKHSLAYGFVSYFEMGFNSCLRSLP